MTIILGLTGYRNTGKTTIANHLKEHHGFLPLHAFAGGKVACEGFFRHLGADQELAREMVHGSLRDEPSSLLPLRADMVEGTGPEHYSPRFFMEMFGNFMGSTLGPEWTAGLELPKFIAENPGRNILVESVVYEEDVLRAQGATIVQIHRPGQRGNGLKTDAAVDRIQADMHFTNDMASPEEMLAAFDARIMRPLRAEQHPEP